MIHCVKIAKVDLDTPKCSNTLDLRLLIASSVLMMAVVKMSIFAKMNKHRESRVFISNWEKGKKWTEKIKARFWVSSYKRQEPLFTAWESTWPPRQTERSYMCKRWRVLCNNRFLKVSTKCSWAYLMEGMKQKYVWESWIERNGGEKE